MTHKEAIAAMLEIQKECPHEITRFVYTGRGREEKCQTCYKVIFIEKRKQESPDAK